MVIVRHKIALKRGSRHYFTGKPCKYGHICKRYTSGRKCFTCQDLRRQSKEYARKVRGMPEPKYPETTKCECCFGPFNKLGPCLDHDHTTGKFRGWLCSSCNVAIGSLGDTVESLQRAINYLRKGCVD